MTFGYDRLFGHVRGVADLDLPQDHLAAAAAEPLATAPRVGFRPFSCWISLEALRKKLQIAKENPDFWCWKARQELQKPSKVSCKSWRAVIWLKDLCLRLATSRGALPTQLPSQCVRLFASTSARVVSSCMVSTVRVAFYVVSCWIVPGCHTFSCAICTLANLKDRKCLLGAFLPGARDSARWADAIRDLIATERPFRLSWHETEGI